MQTVAPNSTQQSTTDHKRTQASTEKHKQCAKSYILLFADVCTMYMYLYMNMYLYLYLNMNMYMIMYLYMITVVIIKSMRPAHKRVNAPPFSGKISNCIFSKKF